MRGIYLDLKQVFDKVPHKTNMESENMREDFEETGKMINEDDC